MLLWILNLGFAASSAGSTVAIIGGPTSYRKWIRFELACRLQCLRYGSLNVGNTQQNIANLLALALTNAAGTQTWARFSTGTNAPVGGAKPTTSLLIYPVNVPGFVKPPNT